MRLTMRPPLPEIRCDVGRLFQLGRGAIDENAPRANSEALMSLMDKMNQQGRGTLYYACMHGTVFSKHAR